MSRILTYHQVMPAYLDFLSVFGSDIHPRDLRFSDFPEQTLLSNTPRGVIAPELGRSGRQFQMCYNIKENVQEITGKHGRPEDRAFNSVQECFKSSLVIHLMCWNWATQEWRWYIQWLEGALDEEASPTYPLEIWKHRTSDKSRLIYTPNDIQRPQRWENLVNEAIVILAANIDVLTALRRYYEDLIVHPDFQLKRDRFNDIRNEKSDLSSEVFASNYGRSKGSYPSTHQSTTSEQNDRMAILTEMSQRESIAMRTITVVTLIYLPATFVSPITQQTFFSTDVIHYQSDAPGSQTTFSRTALVRWFEVTIPLTWFQPACRGD
ncbi:hypothetical protein BKA61DRAFT_582692 [Leptodontidium sp. MPI-SDFR-AT-0119]|nr:hypothetical protein BKA61DRAFT_582692 [Leptodontidium sp. MPI-SDFR-AT-0119]